MGFLRAAVVALGVIVPPFVLTFLVRALYQLGWVMSAVVFLVLLSLWAEGLRALRRSD